jgi:hypothetical protein
MTRSLPESPYHENTKKNNASTLYRQLDAVGQAYIVGAGGQKPLVHPMAAKIAFPGHPRGRVECNGLVGAFLHTGFASRAPLIIQDDDPVFALVNGLFGTGFRTGRGLAVPAHAHVEKELERPTHVLGTFFLHADEPDAGGVVHFLLACDFAGPATPAQGMIDV